MTEGQMVSSDSTRLSEDVADRIAMIRNSALAIVGAQHDLRRIRAARYREPGFDKDVWRKICELGWVGLRVPEEAGGSGLGMREFCVLAEELGAGLVPEPLIACAMSARLLSGGFLTELLSGERLILPAWQEHPNSLAFAEQTRAVQGRVTGRKLFVPAAGAADAFLVTTAQGLVLIERNAPGVSVTRERTVDGGSYGTLTFADAPGRALPGQPNEALEEAILSTSAYLLGLMQASFEMTLDYLKARQQFGRPIGSFQALQHRAVDLKIQISLTRASIESAAAAFDDAAPAAVREAAVSRAKARAAEVSMLVTRQSIQLHGAIGYTDEHDIGLYLRKAMALANLYGSAQVHRDRYATHCF